MKKENKFIDAKTAVYLAKRVVINFHMRQLAKMEKRAEAACVGIFAGIVLLSGFCGVFDATVRGWQAGDAFLAGLLYASAAAIGLGTGVAIYTLINPINFKSSDDYMVELFGIKWVD